MLQKQLKINDNLFDLSTPIVMGIVNSTPDSFFSESRSSTKKVLLKRVEKLLSEGASIIDVGGYSTRPSANFVSMSEELKRVTEAIEDILKEFPDAIISVDTFRSYVVRQVVQNFDIGIINDISGGTLDNNMFETVADLNVAYILMHMRGTPQSMRNETNYDNVVAEVLSFLSKKIAQLRLLGVNDIIVDPGFGFAKTTEQNYRLLKSLPYFQSLEAPILAGISRKTMIQKVLDVTAENALNGTSAANMLALLGGASILRVHDVKEAVQTIKIYEQYIAAS